MVVSDRALLRATIMLLPPVNSVANYHLRIGEHSSEYCKSQFTRDSPTSIRPVHGKHGLNPSAIVNRPLRQWLGRGHCPDQGN